MHAGVFAGVSMYTAHDINFTVVGYAWIAIWYCFAVFEMVYVKKVVDTVQMTTWSRTYYQAWTLPSAMYLGLLLLFLLGSRVISLVARGLLPCCLC